MRCHLPEDIPFFGCSATVCQTHEGIIKKYGGFRREAEGEPGKLAVIRTSVDRPEIVIIVLPLLRRTLTTFNVLHWLLEDMTQPNPTEYHELEIARQTNPHAQPAPDPKRIVMELYSGIKNLCISYERESCYKDSPNSERTLKLCDLPEVNPALVTTP